jgi:hypothetical protein
MAMRGFLGMVTGVVGGGGLALSLAGGCSSSSGAAADGGSDSSGIHRLDSGGGGTDAEEDAAPYTGPALTSCSQSSLSVPLENLDAGPEASETRDGSAEAGAAADAGVAVAGTTGTTCTSDATCKGNVCDLTAPTPVCIVPANPNDPRGANCDPGTGATLQFCDGSSTTSTGAVAVCLPLDDPPQTGQGICVQACQYATDGSPAVGCTGNDACNPSGQYLQAATGNGIIGLGFCGGGCMSNLDCLGPYNKCQVEFGLCTNSEAAVTATACNCSLNIAGTGFCAQACVVGSPTMCPSETVCDALEPTSLVNNATNAMVAAFTKQNPGMGGFCFPTCAGGSCPSNATRTDAYAAGMDCQP